MLAVTTLGMDLSDCPKLTFPHQRIKECLDARWQSFQCESFGGFDLLDCIPLMLGQAMVDSIVKSPPWPQKEKDEAINVAVRVILELPIIFDLSTQGTIDKVNKARFAAASILNNPEFGGRRALFVLAAAVTILETETDPAVANFAISWIDQYVSVDTPMDLLRRAIGQVKRIAQLGVGDDADVAAHAARVFRRLSPMIAPAPQPAPTSTTPTPAPVSVPATPRATSRSTLWPILITAAIVGTGALAAFTVWKLRPVPRGTRRLPTAA